MQTTSLEAWLQGFAQLASVCAVLGGFAFTFLAVLLTYRSRSRLVGAIGGLLMVSAACFLVGAFGWSLISMHAANFGRPQAGTPAHDTFTSGHETLSIALLLGTLTFVLALGLSGWIRSQGMGYASGAVALVAGSVLLEVGRPYIEFSLMVRVSPAAWALLAILLLLGAAAERWRRRRASRARSPSAPDPSPLP